MLSRLLLFFGCLLALNFFSTQKALASHAMGADLTYICLGGDQYTVTLSFYRDCGGITAPSTMSIAVSSSCSGIINLTLPQISWVEVSGLCSGATSTCNGGAYPGVEQYIYTDTVTLPPCNDWLFEWDLCCRNALINNLVSPSSEDMYVRATLDNTGGCNSSPIFTNLPVPYVCSIEEKHYNHGAIDTDGDSIVYTLIQPLGGGGTPIGYTPGYSPTYPIFTTTGNVSFNNQTGQMDFTPIGGQNCVVTILVEEYRNGVLIGTTMRDIQVVDILSCSNFSPTLQAPGIINEQNATLLDTLDVEVCVGASMSYQFIISDPDVPDTIFVSSNMSLAIPGATFSQTGINPVTVTVSWIPTFVDLGLNVYTITFQDNGCPVIGQSIVAFTINVIAGTYAGGDINLCNGDTAQLSAGGGTEFLWIPSNFLSNDTVANPLSWPTTTTTYTVTSNMTGSCANQDDITVNVVSPFTLTTAADVILCNSGAAQLNANASPPDSYTYSWSPASTLDFDTLPNPMASPTVTTVYEVAVTSSSGCTRYATQMVTVAPTPLTTTPTIDDALLCKGTQTMIHANVDAGDCNSYVNTQVVYAPLSGSGTTVTLGDDALSAALPIGFSFNFYCNDYTNFYISSNGFLTFSSGSNGCCAGQVIPNATMPNNLIAFAWEDLSPQTGNLDYFTTGTSPNQILVVNFMNVPHYGSGNMVNTQILLYEGANIVEIHTQEMTSDGGAHTMGIENAGGTLATPVVGRNSTNWSTTNECMRFTPLTPPPYTITWFDSDSNIVGTTEDVPVMPDSSTTYSILITDGSCTNVQTVDVSVSAAFAGPDTAMCLGDTVLLSAFYVGETGADAPTSCGVSAGCTGAGVPTTVGNGTSVNGTSTYPAPYGNWYKNAKHQMLFTAADLQTAGIAPGTITDVGWFITSIAGTNLYKNFTILLGCTQITSLTTWQTGLTLVYTPKNYTIGVGYNNHVLDVQYDWDGTSNIIVEICYDNLSDVSYTSNSASPFTVTGYSSVIYYRSDVTVACPYTAGQTASSNRPNTQFTVCTDSITPVFSWTPGGDLSDSTIAGPLASPSVPTSYVVTVDNGICQVTDTVMVIPSTLNMTSGVLGETCSGMCDGQATVTPTGIAPYTYLWSDVDTQSTATATGLCSGAYSVVVTDAGGCTGTLIDTVPSGGILTTAVQNLTYASCNGMCDGSATMVTSGGTPPYTYLWNDGAAQTTLTATGLCASTYTFTMTDSLGCFTTDSVVIAEPSNLVTSTSVTCMGACNGVAVVAPIGGAPPYTYLWDDPSAQSTSMATALCAGTYTSSVTDSNGCIVIDTIEVAAPYTTVTGTVCSDLSCNGSVTVTPVGSTGPYTFLWNDPSAQTDSTAVSLCPGSYEVQVWDGGGCVMNDTIIVPLPLVTAITDSSMVTCSDLCDGGSTVSSLGGQAPFTFLWDDSNAQTDSVAVSLCVGTYSVQITDGYNCVDTSTVTITGPTALVVQTSATCFGVCDGSANVSTTGGTGPYTYNWSDGQTTSTATGLCGGVYTVTVTDANACVIIGTDTILAPTSQISTVPATCQGLCDGEATVVPVGGVAPFTYLWDDPSAQTKSQATGLCVGWANVNILDSTGCLILDSVQVGEASPIGLVQDNVSNVSCFGFCDGAISYLSPSEGTSPFSFEWYNVAGTPLGNQSLAANGLCTGTYYLEFIDGAGCMTSDTVNLTQPSSIQTTIDTISHVRCNGDCNGVGGVAVVGGTGPYAYIWSDPLFQTTSMATSLCGGKWYVTITDANACSTKDSVLIDAPAKLLSVTDTTRLHCSYDCDGSITATASGGWTPYTYEWTDPALQTTATATGLCAGIYAIRLIDSVGCDVLAMDTVAAVPAPPFNANFNATPLITTIFNSTVLFTDLSTGATQYEWTFGDGSTGSTDQNPEHTFPDDEPGVYPVWLLTTNILGCLDSIRKNVIIKGDFSLFTPSAFTPNSDGLNETFFPKGIGIDEDNFKLMIFDRWGDLIYETTDVREPWDGRANDGERVAQIDTYIWKVETLDDDGLEHEYVGSVTLVH